MVIKVGTGALRANGHPSDSIFFSLASQIARAKQAGYEIVLVSSGAVDAAIAWLTLLGKNFSMLDTGELSSIVTSELLGYVICLTARTGGCHGMAYPQRVESQKPESRSKKVRR